MAQSSPIELLPLGVRQRLVCGALDSLVPIELARGYEAARDEGRRQGDLDVVEGVGHFELVDPVGTAWAAVVTAVREVVE